MCARIFSRSLCQYFQVGFEGRKEVFDGVVAAGFVGDGHDGGGDITLGLRGGIITSE